MKIFLLHDETHFGRDRLVAKIDSTVPGHHLRYESIRRRIFRNFSFNTRFELLRMTVQLMLEDNWEYYILRRQNDPTIIWISQNLDEFVNGLIN